MANSVFVGWIAGIPVSGNGSTVTFSGSVAVTGQFLAADGSVAAPGYAWSSQSGFGEFRSATGRQSLTSGTSAVRQDWGNTWTSLTNHEVFSVDWQTTANVALVGTRTAATGTSRNMLLVAQGNNGGIDYASIFIQRGGPLVTIGLSSANGTFNQSTGVTGNVIQLAAATLTAASGSVNSVAITPTYNQTSGNAANTDLLINRTETAVGGGAQRLIDAQVGGVSQFSVSNTGVVAFRNAVTAAAAVASTHKVQIDIAGTTYYLLATNVA